MLVAVVLVVCPAGERRKRRTGNGVILTSFYLSTAALIQISAAYSHQKKSAAFTTEILNKRRQAGGGGDKIKVWNFLVTTSGKCFFFAPCIFFVRGSLFICIGKICGEWFGNDFISVFGFNFITCLGEIERILRVWFCLKLSIKNKSVGGRESSKQRFFKLLKKIFI